LVRSSDQSPQALKPSQTYSDGMHSLFSHRNGEASGHSKQSQQNTVSKHYHDSNKSTVKAIIRWL